MIPVGVTVRWIGSLCAWTSGSLCVGVEVDVRVAVEVAVWRVAWEEREMSLSGQQKKLKLAFSPDTQ